MTTIQPDGEMIRKAVKWISEERQIDPSKHLRQIIEAAALRFRLPQDGGGGDFPTREASERREAHSWGAEPDATSEHEAGPAGYLD